jgi:hypothetical protein
MTINYKNDDDLNFEVVEVVEPVSCRKCRYYIDNSKYSQCLMVDGNPFLWAEKIKQGLVGKCDDFLKRP